MTLGLPVYVTLLPRTNNAPPIACLLELEPLLSTIGIGRGERRSARLRHGMEK
jgi:hypothetical protein